MIAALLCALLAQTAPAAEPVATVPITEWNNLVLVPVTVQGSSPFQLVLDTAMSAPGILLFSGPRLDALELDFTAGQTVQGAGGQGDPLATR